MRADASAAAQVYGFKTFERLTASGHEEPPAAEPLSEVFGRVSDFYDKVVKPLTDEGKNVLVVSHQYALEPLALYLGGKVRRPRPRATHCVLTQAPTRFLGAPRRAPPTTPAPWTCPTARRCLWRT